LKKRKEPSPGPGHYENFQSQEEKQLKFKKVFKPIFSNRKEKKNENQI
jgi:hypothetical protein